MIFPFNEHSKSANILAQCFHLKRAELGFFLFTPRHGVSFLAVPNPLKNWKKSFFFALSSWSWSFPDRWIEEVPPSVIVGKRIASLSSFLKILNEKPYDCRSLIDERLLGHFGLSPRVEPLGDSLGDIMFNKYLHDYATWDRGEGIPLSRSPRGTRL
ncbi:UNVERIFIED_CONTAM: hypothetical protein Sradi_0001400 [Sesamum radiatum]|uniref:Uncharacterized protein n=1 Tax=Sesamum radiatum TaxID=300843 RepID=A0AAW2WK62_SESRA